MALFTPHRFLQIWKEIRWIYPAPFFLNTKKNGAGFTLVEFIISVSILLVIGGIALTSFFTSRNVHDLAASTENVISLLRLAQSRASAGEDGSQWGMYLEESQVTLFRGASFGSATLREPYPLPQSVRIANISVAGGGSEIIFNRLSGGTNQYGSFSLEVPGSSSFAKTVVIENTGKAYESQTGPAPTGARIIDTRHRTYQLGWSMIGSTNLILTFSDPPGPDTMVTIPMAGFFDAGPTKFNWSGAIPVGGINQTLRIHTLALSGTDTTLSIDRDCRMNTKKVKIAIDASWIATYEASCQALTVGSFGGMMTEP